MSALHGPRRPLAAALAYLVLAAPGALWVAANPATAQDPALVFGVWQHPENGSRIRLAPCGAGLCGTVVHVADGQKTDDKNPNPALRTRPILGMPIIVEAKKTGAATWAGNLYNRIDGGTYAGRLQVKNRGELDMTGCTAIVICRTVTWRRVEESPKK